MNIQIFKNERFGEVRVAEIKEKTYFIGSDVAKALGYERPNDAISAHCKNTVKHRIGVQTGKRTDGSPAIQQVEMLMITESDVYRLIMRSKLPEAEKFQDWVVEEVLPSIRKYGVYATDNVLNNPETLLEALQALNGERKKSKDLEVIIKGLKTQNKMLNSANATMNARIEKQNKLSQSESTNSNSKIAERFFMVVDMLIAAKAVRGRQTFTALHDINNRNFWLSREHPERKLFQPVWISYLMEDFGISGEWVMTGKGRMFNKNLCVRIE